MTLRSEPDLQTAAIITASGTEDESALHASILLATRIPHSLCSLNDDEEPPHEESYT